MNNAEGSLTAATIGIITALPHETAAVRAMLGNPTRITLPGSGAGRSYWVAELLSPLGGVHRVVVAESGMGNNIAAVRATQLLTHCPKVTSLIMCGIAGGIPKPTKAEEHVRLGDIVVSDVKGVVQYDFVKLTSLFVENRATSHRPSAELLEACRVLQSDTHFGKRPWEKWIAKGLKRLKWNRPDDSSDTLADSTEPTKQVPHPTDTDRRSGHPRVFFGPIASANTLLKNSTTRDALREQHGVKAVEMEGSGVQDATWNQGNGYLVVRGICDYCDSNKNNLWQPYAAIAAAAYVRTLLESVPGADTTPQKPDSIEDICELPPPLLDFTGRTAEVIQIVTRLRGSAGRSGRSTILCGMGGIGKSATAIQAAWGAKDEFPDGQLFVDLRGMSDNPMTTVEAMLQIIRTVRPKVGKLPGKQSVLLPMYRKSLAGKKFLVLLDNAKDESQVRSLLSVGPSVAFVITSRNSLALDGVEPIRLDVLPTADALKLLRSIVGANGADEELVSITELCGRLPLALRVAGDFIRLHENWLLSKYINALRDEVTRLKRLKGNSPDRDVEAVLALSARELVRESPELAAQWQMLTVFPTLFDNEATAAVCELWDGNDFDIESADDNLTALLDRSLIQYNTRLKRYSLHDLMRPVAREVFRYGVEDARGLDSKERLENAAARHTEYFTAMLKFSDPEYTDRVVKSLLTQIAKQEGMILGTASSGVPPTPDVGTSNGRKENHQTTQRSDPVADQKASGELAAASEIQDLLKQTLMMQDFQTVLNRILSLPDGDARKNELQADFALGVMSFLRRGIEFADKRVAVNGDLLKQWEGLAAQPAMGDLYWLFAQQQALQAKWEAACQYGERARSILQVHNPTEAQKVEASLNVWREKMAGSPGTQ